MQTIWITGGSSGIGFSTAKKFLENEHCLYLILFIFSFSYGQIDYQTEIQVIFDSNCTSCHWNSGVLDLTSYSSLMAGGNNGAVIVPNDHQSSILWQQINLGSMPPNGSLESSKIDLIKKPIYYYTIKNKNLFNRYKDRKNLIFENL